MADMDLSEFAAMIEETPVRSRVVEYYRPAAGRRRRELVAVCLTDLLCDGVSMVYSFFDPDLTRNSLGNYILLDHVEIAREADLPYVYLGYWVPGSAKMDYKARYQPLEIFSEGRWSLLSETDAPRAAAHRSDRAAISDQVAAIELPVTK
jgi:arginine-tRNA-protein transferase